MKATNFYKVWAVTVFMVGFILATPKQSAAQEWSAGAELGLPGGDLSTGYGNAFGISGRFEKGFSDKMSWLVDGGVLSFAGKNSGPSLLAIPIQGGVKYYFQEQFKGFYGMAEAGFHNLSASQGGYTLSETDFSYAPAVGYRLPNWDFGLKYQTISAKGISANYIGIRVAYVFNPAK